MKAVGDVLGLLSATVTGRSFYRRGCPTTPGKPTAHADGTCPHMPDPMTVQCLEAGNKKASCSSLFEKLSPADLRCAKGSKYRAVLKNEIGRHESWLKYTQVKGAAISFQQELFTDPVFWKKIT